VLLAGLLCAGALCALGQESVQGDTPELRLEAPIDRWDEAIPLGNGLMGGLLWGEGSTVRLSLDRGDLWDLRVPEVFNSPEWTWATLEKLKNAGDMSRIAELFERPYEDFPYPTRIPGGRIELEFSADRAARAFMLDLERAEGCVDLADGEVSLFFSAVRPLAMLKLPAPVPQVRILRPQSLSSLGYEKAKEGADESTRWMLQKTAGSAHAVVAGWKKQDSTIEMAIAITSQADGEDPLAIGRRRVEDGLELGFDELFKEHRVWWADFWSSSSVRVPEESIQRHYDFVKYLYGAGSRKGSPPLPLQGVWTADEDRLPPWKGDYHNDLNTQMTYLAYHAAGLTECGECFLDFQFALLPRYRKFARSFYGVGGAVVPGVMALDGQALGGWAQYSFAPTNGAWVAHSFDLHWKYTRDRNFLRERAYPFCAAVGEALAALLRSDGNGRLRLPLSSSPEVFDNSLRAWLTPNSNYDLALLRWLFSTLAEMALELADEAAAARWQGLFDRLEELEVSDSGALSVARGLRFQESHRHLSHALAIHPLGSLHEGSSEEAPIIITRTLDEILERGTRNWVGYSFSWMACMLARTGRGDEALDDLERYLRGFISRNGFHLNGDQSGTGMSAFTYRPFTLEGNFLAMQAVHEMLLQSSGGTVRVFPAVSERWPDVSFENLRAEGGFKFSAVRAHGQTQLVRVTATAENLLRLLDPFEGAPASFSLPDVERTTLSIILPMKPGETLEAVREG